MMQISEFSFPHLHAAHEERLAVELERRRLAAERRADAAAAAPSAGRTRRAVRSRLARLVSSESGAVRTGEPCAACP
ncbi:hypothetical protein BCL57_001408 [Agromyces flavus]|uniref:Uncharacterized protein n=1 Tax=Agromyces flavus TaxID=589382 RepID=A0ABT1KK52_9MICO|nr:hypothetical protein [Agromyces flavus]MCP2367254.1 hypothetical protein [Agromyces flavus]GGI46095.1 hypothetical protein GCM10010932_12880 [Agromyces flavus]